MKKDFINSVHLEGLIYEHDLNCKTTGEQSKNPGTEYISGTVTIAIDDMNTVPVHYTYVTKVTSKGNTNATFTFLKDLIDGKHYTVMKDGKENATKVRVDTAISLNEFYSDRNGEEELVSVKRNEGGYIHKVDNFNPSVEKRNEFICDTLITKVTRKEADEEKGLPERVILKGAIFDFRKSVLPVEFTVTDSNGMDYYEGAGISSTSPMFVKLIGNQVSESYTRKIEEESAWGKPIVREITNTRKDFVVNNSSVPYEWDSEDTLTADELHKMLAEREIALATLKKRNDDYKASVKGGSKKNDSDGFNF